MRSPSVGLFVILMLTTAGISAGTWSLNTFPGPGHKANPGPWGPGQGASRSEAINDFGVSPVDPNFMLFLTDLSPVAYSSSEHPNEFVTAGIPVKGGSSVAFSAHDGDVGYVLLGQGPNRGNSGGNSGWWRTDNQGRTWHLWYSDIDNEGRTRELYGRCWGTRVLLSDPHATGHRSQAVYLASYSRGLLELSDNETYTTPDGGRVVAFDGKRVKSITTALDGDKTVILSIVQAEGDEKSANKDNGGELWRVVLDASGEPVGNPTKLSNYADWTDVALDPNNAGKGYAVRYFGKLSKDPPRGLVKFDNWGNAVDNAPDVTPAMPTGYPQYVDPKIYSVYINPSNSDHVVLGCHNGWAWQCGFDRVVVYTTNGTSVSPEWLGVNREIVEVDNERYVPDFRFFGPPNFHSSAGDYAFQVREGTQDGGVGRYGSIDFVPGSSKKVRFWGGNWSHRAPMESDDYGATFKPFAHGGTFKDPNQISVLKDDNGTLHMANVSFENGIWISHNGGLSWNGYTHETVNTLSEITKEGSSSGTTYNAKTGWGVEFKPDMADRGQTVIACYGLVKNGERYESYLVRSTDGGGTWRNTGEKALIRYSDNNQGRYGFGHIVHWGNRADGGTAAYVGAKRSRDDGETWATLDYDVFAISASNADIIVGAKCTDKESRQDCAIYYSVDGGDSWSKLTAPGEGIPKANLGLGAKLVMRVDHSRHFPAIDPKSTPENLRVLFASAQGIFIYEGAGEEGTWEGPYNQGTAQNGITLRNGFKNIDDKHYELDMIYFDPREGKENIVYCGNSYWATGTHGNNDEYLTPLEMPYRRVFRSEDGGLNWEPLITDDTPNAYDYMCAYGMEIDMDGRLYVTDWGGVYRYDHESTPVRQSTVGLIGEQISEHVTLKSIGGRLTIASDRDMRSIRIIATNGKTIHAGSNLGGRTRVSMNSLGAGCFVLYVYMVEGPTITRRFVLR